MKGHLLLVLFICSAKGDLLNQENVSKTYFTGSVFEYANTRSLEYNIQAFANATKKAVEMGAEIIIFPENGILPTSSRKSNLPEIIPDPKIESFIPCSQKDKMNGSAVLVPLSCMALEHRIVILANVVEKVICNNTTRADENPCPADGKFLYNTNVVFDSNGKLIARYRKRFLFFEETMNIPPKPESIVFKTSFGKFGTLICFDMIFKEAINLVEEHELDAVLVSTYWFDELPFLSSIQYYQSWALGNGVNLLMSNIHNPSVGAIGSVIHYGGKDKYIGYENIGSTLLVSKVPLKNFTRTSQSINYNSQIFPVHTNENKSTYKHTITDFANYTLIKLNNNKSNEIEACNNGLCCFLNYSSANTVDDHYYFGAFNGTKSVRNHYFWEEEVCVLFACSSLSNKTCQIIPLFSNTVFDRIILKGNFSTKYIYPSVLANNMTLISKENWEYKRGIGKLETGRGVNLPLIAVSLYGRCYDRDPPYKK